MARDLHRKGQEMMASHGNTLDYGCRTEAQTLALSRCCQELSCSVVSLLSETIRAWCHPKFTSSLSPSSLFGMWNQNTLAPQRGSRFLKQPRPFLPSPGVLIMEAEMVTGELPTKPKPPWSCAAGGVVVFGLRSQLKTRGDFGHMQLSQAHVLQFCRPSSVSKGFELRPEGQREAGLEGQASLGLCRTLTALPLAALGRRNLRGCTQPLRENPHLLLPEWCWAQARPQTEGGNSSAPRSTHVRHSQAAWMLLLLSPLL